MMYEEVMCQKIRNCSMLAVACNVSVVENCNIVFVFVFRSMLVVETCNVLTASRNVLVSLCNSLDFKSQYLG